MIWKLVTHKQHAPETDPFSFGKCPQSLGFLMLSCALQAEDEVPSILLKKLPSKEKSLVQLIQGSGAKKKGAIFRGSVKPEKKNQNLGELLAKLSQKKPKADAAPETKVSEVETEAVDLTSVIEDRKREDYIENAPSIPPVDLDQLENLAKIDHSSKRKSKTKKEAFLELPPAI